MIIKRKLIPHLTRNAVRLPMGRACLLLLLLLLLVLYHCQSHNAATRALLTDEVNRSPTDCCTDLLDNNLSRTNAIISHHGTTVSENSTKVALIAVILLFLCRLNSKTTYSAVSEVHKCKYNYRVEEQILLEIDIGQLTNIDLQ